MTDGPLRRGLVGGLITSAGSSLLLAYFGNRATGLGLSGSKYFVVSGLLVVVALIEAVVLWQIRKPKQNRKRAIR